MKNTEPTRKHIAEQDFPKNNVVLSTIFNSIRGSLVLIDSYPIIIGQKVDVVFNNARGLYKYLTIYCEINNNTPPVTGARMHKAHDLVDFIRATHRITVRNKPCIIVDIRLKETPKWLLIEIVTIPAQKTCMDTVMDEVMAPAPRNTI